jgi:hypothetical protein
MCDFLEFDGADFRHGPPNADGDDLLTQWQKDIRKRKTLPSRAKGPIRAQLKSAEPARPKRELGWTGGKAGS